MAEGRSAGGAHVAAAAAAPPQISATAQWRRMERVAVGGDMYDVPKVQKII